MSGLIQAVNVLNLDKQKIKEMPFDISFMAPLTVRHWNFLYQNYTTK